MVNRIEKILGFGKKEVLSPTDALRKLYETDDEIGMILDAYAKRRTEVLAYSDVTPADRAILSDSEAEAVSALAEQGINVDRETLERFLDSI